MNLWDELAPLAEELETARELVVEAARKQVAKADHGGATELVDAVAQLDQVQMALGLKTAQLLLKRGKERGEEIPDSPLAEALANQYMRDQGVNMAKAVIPKDARLGPWSKKERASE
jgi:hypothetical protein